MADFVQTMKDWRRMCIAMEKERPNDACCGCRLEGYGCPAIYEDNSHVDFRDVEKQVSAWAAEHPEPVYPTWFEWLEKIGVAGRAYELEPYFAGDKEIYMRTAAFTPKAFEHIPADIAEKLGIGPKEG